VAAAGARLSAMAKRRFQFSTSPEAAASLYKQNASEGHTGCMAALAPRHSEQPNRTHGQHRCGTRAQGQRGQYRTQWCGSSALEKALAEMEA
jgi:hypothetical protein